MWKGETVAIIAGGPSVNQKQIDYIFNETTYKSIAINNSYQLAPKSDMLYFCDLRWYTWHKDNKLFINFKGIRVTLKNNQGVPEDIHSLNNTGPIGLETDPTGLKTGSNSGYQVLNLCYHLQVKNIILIGYDMRVVNGKTHWHKAHKHTPSHKIYKTNLLPKMNNIIEPLKSAGINVLNCTPGSALECFTKVELGKEGSMLQ